MELNKIKLGTRIFILFVLLLFVNPFARNSFGYRQVVENPISGETWTQFDQGVYFAGFFSKIYTYPNVVTTMFSAQEIDEEITAFHPPFTVRFNDATKASAEATVRWRLPSDNESMLKIHKEYHSPGKLASTSLTKYARECLKYSAQLMESETHYSGGMSKLSEDFQSQLEEGQYIIEYKTEYVKDTITGEDRKLTRTFIRHGANNIPIRNKSDVQQFNITVAYASIDAIDYEEQVDRKLAKKIEASTQESISKQQLITAQQEALTEKARGEQLIAKTRAVEQAAKEEATIRAQKAVEVERLAKLQAKEYAQKVVYEGDAKAAANRALVNAGLTPQERAEWKYKTQVGIAAELAKRPVPQFIMGGTGNSSGLSKAYTMESMLVMMNKLNSKK